METPCPYKCISERYKMPHCNTALEELIYTFGGPWLFGFILFSLLILLALVLSVARMKFAGGDELPGLVPNRRRSTIDRSFPFLESLNEVFYLLWIFWSISIMEEFMSGSSLIEITLSSSLSFFGLGFGN